MLYRLYERKDFDALYAIEEVCFKPPLRFSRRYMGQLVVASNAATWIAEEDGRMAGFGLVDWVKEGDALIAYVQTLEVVEEKRGSGVGGALIDRMEGSARRANAEVIWLHVDEDNSRAIHLYEKHGYLREDREENYYPQGRAALIYAKQL